MTDDRDAMRKTILARIATRDTSIPNPTPEQFAETTRLLEGVLKSLGGKHKDYALMLKLLKDLRTRKGASKQPPAEPAEGGAEASGDPRELQQAAGGGDVLETPSAVPDYEAEMSRRRAIDAKAADPGPLYEGEPITDALYLGSKKRLARRTSSRAADAIVREYEKHQKLRSQNKKGPLPTEPDYEAEMSRRRAIGAKAPGSGPLYEGEPIAESQYLMSKKILASRTSSRTADAIVREYEKYHDPVSMGETGASGGTGPGPTHRGVPVTEGQYVLAKKIEARGRDSRLANEIIREYEEYHNIRSQNKKGGR